MPEPNRHPSMRLFSRRRAHPARSPRRCVLAGVHAGALRCVLAAVLVCVPGVASCEPETPSEPSCFFGERGAPLEAELVYRSRTGESVLLEDGGAVPLTVPPQGGHVMFIGVRARNLDMCRATLSAAFHDGCTASEGNHGRIVGREGRHVTFEARSDGYAWPKDPQFIDNFANIPACPNFASTRDVDDERYLVRVRLTDEVDERFVLVEAHIVPECEAGDDACRCTCDRAYVLGSACGEDIVNDDEDPAAGGCFPAAVAEQTAAPPDP